MFWLCIVSCDFCVTFAAGHRANNNKDRRLLLLVNQWTFEMRLFFFVLTIVDDS